VCGVDLTFGMASRTTDYRRKLKETNPVLYEEYLMKQREQSKKNRDALKKELQKKKPSQTSMQKRDKQLEKQRERQKKYWEKKKQEILNGETPEKLKVKIPVFKKHTDRTRLSINSKKDYNRVMKTKQRSGRSRQKVVSDKKKDRDRKALK
jgi:hypothetical protein